jgi:NifU-like protein
LGDLHGLGDDELGSAVSDALGSSPEGRLHCFETAFSALRAAFADHRARLIDEFTGEKALVCTCFGVTEERIELFIATSSPDDIDEVTAATRAGGGCGSCRMLIQEMLDLAHDI